MFQPVMFTVKTMDNPNAVKSVSEFYSGKNIFLTGATGFVGKVFIEKLIRSCPDIGIIYCLVRAKKGIGASERITNMCKEKVFDRLRNENPKFIEKLKAIEGNIEENCLGMSESDKKLIEEEIHIIFNSAANVNFKQPLKQAVISNVLPAQRLAHISTSIRNLECFVHISTAYAYCDREFVEEIIYPMQMHPSDIVERIRNLDTESVELNMPKLLGKHPNAYTYTKCLAENVLALEMHSTPLVIIRPSIIGPAMKEPFEGFIDQMSGLSVGAIGVGKGIIQTYYADKSIAFDLIPVDICVNVMITCAWQKSLYGNATIHTIYQPTTSLSNPITLGELGYHATNAFNLYPLERTVMAPASCLFTKNRWRYKVQFVIRHLIPAVFIDILRKLSGKRPKLLKLYLKLLSSAHMFEYFVTNSWAWSGTNMAALRSCLSAADEEDFPMDVKQICWPEYIEKSIKGIQPYLLKEEVMPVAAEKRENIWIRALQFSINIIGGMLALKLAKHIMMILAEKRK